MNKLRKFVIHIADYFECRADYVISFIVGSLVSACVLLFVFLAVHSFDKVNIPVVGDDKRVLIELTVQDGVLSVSATGSVRLK